MEVSNINQVTTHNQTYSIAGIGQAKQHIRCVSLMTFSQKLYKHNALEIAQEYEQAIEENSLEKIKNLLDRLVALSA